MGKNDNRRTLKTKQRRGQVKKKARLARRAEEKKGARKKSA